MTTNPNLAPILPANANVDPHIANTDPVPQPNEILSPEQAEQDVHDLQQAINQLGMSRQGATNADLANASGTGHQFLENVTNEGSRSGGANPLVDPARQALLAHIKRRKGNIQDAQDSIVDTIGGIARRSDTTDILQRLAAAHRISSAHENTARASADKARLAADAAGHQRRASVNLHYAITQHQAAHPIPGKGEPGYDAALTKLRSRQLARSSQHAGSHVVRSHDANAAHAIAERQNRNGDGFSTALNTIHNDIRNEHERTVQEMTGLRNEIYTHLAAWGVRGQEAYHGQEDDIRDRLEELADIIDDPNRLSRYDQARAEAQADLVALRHRLEARAIVQDSTTGSGNLNTAVYEPDRGIKVTAGGEGVILYEDGSTGRLERALDGSWSTVRRTADGQLWQPCDSIQLNPDLQVSEPLDRIFTRWETSRTPENTIAAHAALSKELGYLTANEATLTERLQKLRARRDAAQVRLAEINPLIVGLRGSTGQEDLAKLVALQTEQAGLTNTLNLIAIDGPRLSDQRRTVRERMSPMRYWQGYLEVGTERPEPAQARNRGRFAMRRTVRQEDDALPNQPLIQRDGSLQWGGLTLHGRRDNWRIWPDGLACRTDDTGRTIYYNPDGSRR